MTVPRLLILLLVAGCVWASPAAAQEPTASINDVTVAEGNSDEVTAEFTVTLSEAPTFGATVNYATADDSAVQPADYTAASGTLTFGPLETTKTIQVLVKGDSVDEIDEQFRVNLSNASGATIVDGQGIGTITDDDSPPAVIVEDTTVGEAAGAATFKVKLSSASGQDVTVGYATADGSAGSSDYTGETGSVTIPAGQLEAEVTVDVTADAIDEPNETFKLGLADTATNATVAADEEGTAIITDDDSPPAVIVEDTTVGEAAGAATFKVKLSSASGQDVTVGYATADGSAGSSDYTGETGSVTIPAGQLEAEVTVDVTADAIDEPNETFKLGLADTATNATVAADEEGTAIITDDDSPPAVIVEDTTVGEAAGAATFKVKLSSASGQDVTVGYATADGSAGSSDYTGETGSVTIPAGQLEAEVTVDVTADAIDEPNETFKLGLADTATNATVAADEEGTAIITDDDDGPTVTVDDLTVAENDPGGAGDPPGTADFKVKLSAASGQPVTIGYATANGTAGSGDYTGTTDSVTFAPGETEKAVSVAVTNDPSLEPNETFSLTLADTATNATVAANEEGQATILNDDPANRPPVARFTPNPPRAFIAKGVLLDGQDSSDPEGRPLTFSWDLDGNGSHETPTGSDPRVLTAFCSPGLHSLGLKVTDAGSVSDPTRKTSATSGTVEAVQASPDNSCDQVAPELRISRISRSLRRALRRSLAVRLRCSEACTMTTSAGVDRRTGRRLGLRGRRRTLGKASGALTTAGSKRLPIKFSRFARRKLRRAQRVRVTLRITVKDAALNPLTLRRTITLRR